MKKAEAAETVTFSDLCDSLLVVSGKIANGNKMLLYRSSIGTKIHERSRADHNSMSGLISNGIKLAGFLDEKLRQEPGTNVSHYDVFLSHSGKEKLHYVDQIEQGLKTALGETNIFLDRKSLHGVIRPKTTMFRALLQSEVIVSVFTFNAVHNKWPIAEFLCGLARVRKQEREDDDCHGCMIIDSYPGQTWMESDTGASRHPKHWVDDLAVLFPTELPSMLLMTAETTSGKKYLFCFSSNMYSLLLKNTKRVL